jgi:hypothetical protein
MDDITLYRRWSGNSSQSSEYEPLSPGGLAGELIEHYDEEGN